MLVFLLLYLFFFFFFHLCINVFFSSYAIYFLSPLLPFPTHRPSPTFSPLPPSPSPVTLSSSSSHISYFSSSTSPLLRLLCHTNSNSRQARMGGYGRCSDTFSVFGFLTCGAPSPPPHSPSIPTSHLPYTLSTPHPPPLSSSFPPPLTQKLNKTRIVHSGEARMGGYGGCSDSFSVFGFLAFLLALLDLILELQGNRRKKRDTRGMEGDASLKAECQVRDW